MSTEKLQQLIGQANRLVAFTGAGISAESGIPTYRGDDGLWNKYDPAKYASVDYFFKDPAYYWNFFREVRYPLLKQAQPNPAHIALARLEAGGRLNVVITQNIDGLHQLAGSQNVLELHGNTRRIICVRCKTRYSMDDIYNRLDTQFPPRCPACDGALKPEVVFFGESLPAAVLREAIQESEACDLFIVIGSSLVVQPAAWLPARAKERGAKLVIINKDPTPLDSLADLLFHSSASEVLKNIKAE